MGLKKAYCRVYQWIYNIGMKVVKWKEPERLEGVDSFHSIPEILEQAGVDKDKRVSDWTDDEAGKIREIIAANYKVEGDLRSEIALNIKRLMDIGCYRGVRHRNGLPVRGQSTKNNARTRKGKKKTVANKKKATK